ncbi:Peptidoglycan/LPS O-acetylase OafA/YrhL, contains acyltransferase and SGNH-hydrolase domains [Pseudobutyrivibrio sp. OR37]|uniref:acyltransferase n=1 Tax=Pseudobutyrivibrio sp. OR37 TaxID=1798186 RepID=UPI0008E8F891|nr:acyltransferase [Pseudobutyrivibrio sp. OR37]SFH54417.1 Peptidoglycan/LPS O-acetylase OafA/YrhL, contains acyltransferase and SGNH-hydrolase domains [Pseudobutyrivibrio sp. OR37]
MNDSSIRKFFYLLYWAGVLLGGIYIFKCVIGTINYFVIISLIGGCIIGIIKSQSQDDYLKQTIALKTDNRVLVYDYLRCVASIMVVAVHKIGADLAVAAEIQESNLYRNLDFTRLLCCSCNVIFVMLSGALLLQYRDEKMIFFIKRRLSKIAIPLILYFYIYYLFFSADGNIEKVSIGVLIGRIISGKVGSVHALHFWFMYVLLFLYILFFFLRYMLKDISYMLLSKMIIFLFVLSIIEICIPIELIDIKAWNLLGWCLIAIMGFWFTKDETRKYDKLFIIAGIVSAIAMWVIYINDSDSVFISSNFSVLRYFVACGLFALLYNLQKHLKNYFFIRFLSKYSYGMILIHHICIGIITPKLAPFSSLTHKGVGAIISILGVTIVSLIVAFFIENTFVAFYNGIFDVSLVRKIKKSK